MTNLEMLKNVLVEYGSKVQGQSMLVYDLTNENILHKLPNTNAYKLTQKVSVDAVDKSAKIQIQYNYGKNFDVNGELVDDFAIENAAEAGAEKLANIIRLREQTLEQLRKVAKQCVDKGIGECIDDSINLFHVDRLKDGWRVAPALKPIVVGLTMSNDNLYVDIWHNDEMYSANLQAISSSLANTFIGMLNGMLEGHADKTNEV